MNKHFKKLLLVSAASMALTGLAHADGSSITVPGTDGWSVTGSGTLKFSSALLTALNAGDIGVAKVAPADVTITRNTKNKYSGISAEAPVTSLTGSFDGTNLAVEVVRTNGGALLTAENDDLTNSGGSLSITNIGVDLTTQTVFADVEGGNNVGKIAGLAMWKYATISGPTSVLANGTTSTAANELKGLSITPQAYNTFVQSLGLLEAGVAAMNRITDYGVLNSSISVTSPPVPEPETVALAVVGLLTVAALRRKKAAV